MLSSYQFARSTTVPVLEKQTNPATLHVESSRWERRPNKKLPSPWFVSREIDLMFVCGLAPWFAGLVFFLVTGAGGAYPQTKFPQQGLTLFFVFASLVIGESHQFTSLVRYYSPSFRKRTKRYILQRLPIWFLYVLVAELFLLSSLNSLADLISWSFFLQGFILNLGVMAFPAVLMQHVCAQASAVVQQYCRRAGYTINKGEKFMLDAASWLLVATGACSIAVPFGIDDSAGLNLSFAGIVHISSYIVPLAVTSACACAILAMYVFYRGVAKDDWPPLGAVLLAINSVALILLAIPLPAMVYVWLFVPLFFHATQHWALAWSVRQREVLQESDPPATKNNSVLEVCKFIAPAMTLTAVVLFIPLFIHRIPIHLGNIDSILSRGETLSVFFSMFVFYAHYFADRVVWRPKN